MSCRYIEYQPNQHFLGGALGYATARDWARFGLLFRESVPLVTPYNPYDPL